MIRPVNRPDRKGFTLVEVVVAIMIGTIGLLALSGLLIKITVSNTRATDITIATALARQKIEQIKLVDYNYVVDEDENNLDANGNVVTGGGKYTRETRVTANVAAFNTKTVDVTVYFSPSKEDPIKKAIVSTVIYP